MKATSVKAMDNYKLFVTFDDGVTGIVDLEDLTLKGIFRELRDLDRFANVYVTGEAIAWNDDLEIDALNVYSKIADKKPSELVQKSFLHATD